MALTASKQVRKPFTVLPLVAEKQTQRETSPIDAYAIELQQKIGTDGLDLWWTETSQRRLDLEIPAARLAKMEAAVAKALKIAP